MANIDDIEIPTLLFDEQASAPATPATGLWRAYFKSDGLYIIDDAGTEVGPLGTGGGGGSGAAVGAKVYRTTVQSIPGSTATAVLWDAEEYDTDGLHSTSTNTSRLTVPTGQGGKWHVSAKFRMDVLSSGVEVQCRLYVNGTRVLLGPNPRTTSANSNIWAACETDLSLAAGDYVELFAWHTDSTARDLNISAENSHLAMHRIGA